MSVATCTCMAVLAVTALKGLAQAVAVDRGEERDALAQARVSVPVSV